MALPGPGRADACNGNDGRLSPARRAGQGTVRLNGCIDIAGSVARRRRAAGWLCLLACLCLLLSLPALPARAGDGRHFMVSSWTMNDGLPHNLVHVAAQDRDGFIWLGTWEGVVRFNGRHFTLFDRQNTPGMELAGIFKILPEADGGVLFGTIANGVFRYYQGRWQHLGGEDAHNIQVSALLRDPGDGALWLASGTRLLRLDAAGRLHDVGPVIGLPVAGLVTSLAWDEGMALLVGTESGLFRMHDGKALPWGRDWAGDTAVRGVRSDGEGGWLVASDDGLHWRRADGRVEHLHAGQRVETVLRDRVGAVWTSMSSGSLLRYIGGSVEQLSVPGTVSPALLADREGLVWAGGTDGLHRVMEVAAVGITRADGLHSDYVRVVMQSEDDALWIGHTGGLSRWWRGQMRAVPLALENGRDVSALALAYRDGNLWVGSYNQGVFRLDLQGQVRERIRLGGRIEPTVRALLADADGGLWIGGTHGLSHYRAGKLRRVLDSQGLSSGAVMALHRDPDGTLWIGTTGGMHTLRGDGTLRHWQPDRDMPAQYVFDFLRDAAGDLWIASDRGLLRMRGETFRTYDHRVGMPRDKLFRILDDQQGHLWLSSNQGVFRIARSDFDQVDSGERRQLAVHVIDHSDGMPGSQGNGSSMPAGWRAGNGALMFPTSAGLGVIDPLLAGRYDGEVPPVVFESMAVDGVEQPPGASHRLEPGTRRLAVVYAAMNFRAPDKLRYRYRLHGFDAGWVEAGSNTEAVYTNLPPGNYRLEVQAMTLPLDWGRKQEIGSAVMGVEVVPPFWKRTSARMLGAVALLGLVALGVWLRTASYRRRQRRLHREIAARTEELREKNRALEAADHERSMLMRKLAHQATHDELTGLPNRRAADRRLQQAIARAHALGTPLCVALTDVDHFKRINDAHGHEVGDRVLQQVAAVLRDTRAPDAAAEALFAARHGGEEFLLVLEDMEHAAALRYLGQLHACIAALRIELPERQEALQVTVSIGAACLGPGQSDARTLLAAADRQLYEAKRAGRNQILG